MDEGKKVRPRKIAPALLALILVISVLSFFPIEKAQAYANTQLWTQDYENACGATPVTINLAPHETAIAKDPIMLSSTNLVSNYITGITDNLGDYWVKAVGSSLSSPYALDTEIWYVPSSVGGSLTQIVISFSSNPTSCQVEFSQYDVGPVSALQTYQASSAPAILTTQVDNVVDSTTPVGASTLWFGVSAARTSAIGSAQFLSLNGQYVCGTLSCKSAGNNGLFTSFASTNGIGSCGGGAGYCVDSGWGWFFAAAATNTAIAGTLHPGSIGGSGGGMMNTLVESFTTGQSVTVPPTIQTIGCLGHNATSFTATQNDIYYIEAQAPPYGATIFNVTAYFASVATASSTIAIGVYTASSSNQSTPGVGTSAFVLQQSYSAVIGITASSFKFSTPVSVPVHAWSYWLVAVAQTDTGTGVVKFLEGGPSPMYVTANTEAKNGLPAQINLAGATVTTRIACISGQALLTGANINVGGTNTVTVTATVGGGAPSSFITNPNSPILFLVLLLPAALFLFATRNVIGGIVGLLIGATVAYLVPPTGSVLPAPIFVGLIIALVAAAAVANRAGG